MHAGLNHVIIYISHKTEQKTDYINNKRKCTESGRSNKICIHRIEIVQTPIPLHKIASTNQYLQNERTNDQEVRSDVVP